MNETNTTEAVAVLRDTSTGDCILVNTGTKDNLDEVRLQESWLELAGWLHFPEQASGWVSDDCSCEDEDDPTPCFTTCEWEGCERLIVLIDGQAPEYCSGHAEANV